MKDSSVRMRPPIFLVAVAVARAREEGLTVSTAGVTVSATQLPGLQLFMLVAVRLPVVLAGKVAVLVRQPETQAVCLVRTVLVVAVAAVIRVQVVATEMEATAVMVWSS